MNERLFIPVDTHAVPLAAIVFSAGTISSARQRNSRAISYSRCCCCGGGGGRHATAE